MKTFNRKLLAIPGLFVALCALTSFNPFSQVKHLSYIQREESITLAQSVPSSGKRSSVEAARHGGAPVKVDATLAGKKPTTAPAAETAEAKLARETKEKEDTSKTAKVEADKAKGSQSSSKVKKEDKEEEDDCTGKDCAVDKSSSKKSQVKDFSEIAEKLKSKKPLTDEENELLAEKIMESQDTVASSDDESEEDDESNFCSDGDYSDRLKCFKKEKKTLFKKKSTASPETRGRFKEDVADFIAEVVLDDSLETGDRTDLLNKISRFVKDDRNLSADVKIGLQSINAKRSEESFSRGLEAQVQNIESLNMRISELQNMQRMYGFNAQAQFELDQRSIERQNLVYGMEKQIAGYRESIRRSLPAPKSGESTLITQLRDQRTASYQSLIEPIAPAITDKRLVTLDYSLSGSPIAPGQNGVHGPAGTTPGLNPGGVAYDPANPGATFAGVDRSVLQGMNPQQQVDYRRQNGIMYNPAGNNYASATPYAQGQQTGMPGQIPGQMPGQRVGPTQYNGY